MEDHAQRERRRIFVPTIGENIRVERDALRVENARLLAALEATTVATVAAAPRTRKPAATVDGRTKREAALLAEGQPPFKGAIWFGPRMERPGQGMSGGWGIKRRKLATVAGSFPAGAAVRGGEVAAYLAATGKATVPAHDPAFGRR